MSNYNRLKVIKYATCTLMTNQITSMHWSTEPEAKKIFNFNDSGMD